MAGSLRFWREETPMSEIIETTICCLDELSDTAKDKAWP